MKKRTILLLLASTLFVGCGNKSVDSTTQQVGSNLSVSVIGKKLKEKNLVEGEPSQVSFQMLGAKDGVKYLKSYVEIYQFDIKYDVYKSLKKTNEVKGLKISAINGPFVLIASNNVDLSEELIKEFKNLK